MADDNRYDMRQKLLTLQNELIKGASEKKGAGSSPSSSTGSVSASQGSYGAISGDRLSELSSNRDVIALLKDLRLGQQKIMSLLIELNNKLDKYDK